MYDDHMARPTRKLDTLPRVEIQSRAEWRAWLQAHHATSGSIWFVNYKKSSGGPHVPYDDIVEEALCFGWIDGLVRSLDDRRGMALLPRKPGSSWSKSNKERVERLIAAGANFAAWGRSRHRGAAYPHDHAKRCLKWW